MAYTFDTQIVSDLHKDARGFRPSEYFWEEWYDSSDFDRQAIWDGLLRELDAEMESQRHAEEKAMLALHQRIQGAMILGAKNEVQALKWIIQAEEFDDIDLQYGADYFCYHFDLNYSASKELPIQEAINAYTSALNTEPGNLEARWKLLRAFYFKGGAGRRHFDLSVHHEGP